MTERWECTHGNGTTDYATLKKYDGTGWFVDMGCVLWDRYYKSYNWAVKYLKKSGYTRSKEACHDI